MSATTLLSVEEAEDPFSAILAQRRGTETPAQTRARLQAEAGARARAQARAQQEADEREWREASTRAAELARQRKLSPMRDALAARGLPLDDDFLSGPCAQWSDAGFDPDEAAQWIETLHAHREAKRASRSQRHAMRHYLKQQPYIARARACRKLQLSPADVSPYVKACGEAPGAQEIRAYLDAAVDPDRRVDWWRAGFDAQEAARWEARGYAPTPYDPWRTGTPEPDSAPAWVKCEVHSPEQADAWRSRGLGARDAAPWVAVGLSPEDRDAICAAGFDAEQAYPGDFEELNAARLNAYTLPAWLAAGFAPTLPESSHARHHDKDRGELGILADWVKTELSPELAAAWRAADVSPEQASAAMAGGLGAEDALRLGAARERPCKEATIEVESWRWDGHGYSPQSARRWTAAGFQSHWDADPWRAEDFSPSEAQAWRGAGHNPTSAALARELGQRPEHYAPPAAPETLTLDAGDAERRTWRFYRATRPGRADALFTFTDASGNTLTRPADWWLSALCAGGHPLSFKWLSLGTPSSDELGLSGAHIRAIVAFVHAHL